MNIIYCIHYTSINYTLNILYCVHCTSIHYTSIYSTLNILYCVHYTSIYYTPEHYMLYTYIQWQEKVCEPFGIMWSFIIQYQTVRYDILPLSPTSRNRLNQVKRKVLVLDLDETLIHSHHDGVLRPTVRPGTPPDFILKVVIDKHPVRFFVHKRPHVDFFLEVVSQWYELVVFTASMEIYGSAVADKLDNNKGVLRRRFYRQHCTLELGSYIKDLSVVHSDLSSVVILDNSPGAYRSHPDNAIPIKSWFSDPSDTALLNLLPMLDALRFTADVRSVLSRNLHQHRLW
uniref:protein-serine/threonine phosphatase n=1 Tax=Leptobrachium leishanense TaxID=445787 RepID=A0A8C5QGS9_9ANUR